MGADFRLQRSAMRRTAVSRRSIQAEHMESALAWHLSIAIRSSPIGAMHGVWRHRNCPLRRPISLQYTKLVCYHGVSTTQKLPPRKSAMVVSNVIPLPKIEDHQVLAQSVAALIENAIIYGELAEGQRLAEASISQQTGVSRSPI